MKEELTFKEWRLEMAETEQERREIEAYYRGRAHAHQEAAVVVVVLLIGALLAAVVF